MLCSIDGQLIAAEVAASVNERGSNWVRVIDRKYFTRFCRYNVGYNFEKVPRDIQGEKSRKDMRTASSGKLVSTIGA